MRDNMYKIPINPFNPEWYQQVFDQPISTDDQTINTQMRLDQGFIIPDADGSKSSVFRNRAVLNNSFSEDTLRTTLKDIHWNRSHKLTAANTDEVDFFQWHGQLGTILDPNAILPAGIGFEIGSDAYIEWIGTHSGRGWFLENSNTDVHLDTIHRTAEFRIPWDRFINQKERDVYKLSQLFDRWVKIEDILRNWKVFKWNLMLFINQRVYSDYEFWMDEQEVIVRFKYKDEWVNNNLPISIYKFPTNFQWRQLITFNNLRNNHWKIPISMIDNKNICNYEKVIVAINRVSDLNTRRDGMANVNVIGDNLEFIDVKDGYLDFTNISKFNRQYITFERNEPLWFSIFVPKFLYEFPILLPTDIIHRPRVRILNPVVSREPRAAEGGVFQDVHSNYSETEPPFDLVYADPYAGMIRGTPGWLTMVRPMVLSDAYKNPEFEPLMLLIYELRGLEIAISGSNIQAVDHEGNLRWKEVIMDNDEVKVDQWGMNVLQPIWERNHVFYRRGPGGSIMYEKDDDGNYVYDAEGNPVPIIIRGNFSNLGPAGMLSQLRTYMRTNVMVGTHFRNLLDVFIHKMHHLKHVYDRFYIIREADLNMDFLREFQRLMRIIDLIKDELYLNEETPERSSWHNTRYLESHRGYRRDTLWSVTQAIFDIVRQIIRDRHIVQIIRSIYLRRWLWNDPTEFLGQVRYQRPIGERDIWVFEYDERDEVWRPANIRVRRQFPDVYLLDDPNNINWVLNAVHKPLPDSVNFEIGTPAFNIWIDTTEEGRAWREENMVTQPRVNRLFKAFLYYSDTMNPLEKTRPLVETPTVDWDDTSRDYHTDPHAIYRDIFMEKFYWLGIQTIYPQFTITGTRWEIIEMVIDNPLYDRFNELFLKTMDPYFRVGMATYLQSDDWEFMFDNMINRFKESVSLTIPEVNWSNFQRVTNFEAYLNNQWKPAFFDNITNITSEWEYEHRIIRRPPSTFDIRRIIPFLRNMKNDMVNIANDVVAELNWIIEQLELEDYGMASTIMDTGDVDISVKGRIIGFRDNLNGLYQNMHDIINRVDTIEMDIDLYSIQDIKNLVESLTNYTGLFRRIELDINDIYGYVNQLNHFQSKLDQHNFMQLLYTSIPRMLTPVYEALEKINVPELVKIITDLRSFARPGDFHPRDRSLMQMINLRIDRPFTVEVEAARDALFQSSIRLLQIFHPSKSYTTAEFSTLREGLRQVKADLSTTKNVLLEYWRQQSIPLEPDKEIVDKLDYIDLQLHEFMFIFGQYLEARLEFYELTRNINRRFKDMLRDSPYISKTERGFFNAIQHHIGSVLHEVSHLKTPMNMDKINASTSAGQLSMNSWLAFIRHEREVFTRLLNLLQGPSPHMDHPNPGFREDVRENPGWVPNDAFNSELPHNPELIPNPDFDVDMLVDNRSWDNNDNPITPLNPLWIFNPDFDRSQHHNAILIPAGFDRERLINPVSWYMVNPSYPYHFLDLIQQFNAEIVGLIIYMQTINGEFIPEGNFPTYAEIFRPLTATVHLGGFNHQLGDVLYLRQLGSYKITAIQDHDVTITDQIAAPRNLAYTVERTDLVEPEYGPNYNQYHIFHNFRNPFREPVPHPSGEGYEYFDYRSISTGAGMGATVRVESYERTPIINDELVTPYFTRIQNIIKVVNRSILTPNPYDNGDLGLGVQIIRNMFTSWAETVDVASDHISQPFLDSMTNLIELFYGFDETLEKFMENRARMNIFEFARISQRFVAQARRDLTESNLSCCEPFEYMNDIESFLNGLNNTLQPLHVFIGNGRRWYDVEYIMPVIHEIGDYIDLWVSNISQIPEVVTILEKEGNTLTERMDEIKYWHTSILDGFVHHSEYLQAVMDQFTPIQTAFEERPTEPQIDEWYRLASVLPARAGSGYQIGDIVRTVIHQYERDEDGLFILDENNQRIISLDEDGNPIILGILFFQVARIDNSENGRVLDIRPLIHYGLEFDPWGTFDTDNEGTNGTGNGTGLRITLTSHQIDVNDFDFNRTPRFVDMFDENDLIMFNYENNHSLNIDYEVFIAGLQMRDFIRRHKAYTDSLDTKMIDIIYLNANQVMNLQHSALHIQRQHYFVYRIDAIHIDEERIGRGYRVGQRVFLNAGEIALRLRIESLRHHPHRIIESVSLLQDNFFRGYDPEFLEPRMLSPDTLNNIDDEYNVGRYDQLTTEGEMVPVLQSSPTPDYPNFMEFHRQRFDLLDGDDRNAMFMYPDLPLPEVSPIPNWVNHPFITGQWGLWYHGTRIYNPHIPAESNVWNGIMSLIPSTYPFFSDALRTPPGMPIKGEYHNVIMARLSNHPPAAQTFASSPFLITSTSPGSNVILVDWMETDWHPDYPGMGSHAPMPDDMPDVWRMVSYSFEEIMRGIRLGYYPRSLAPIKISNTTYIHDIFDEDGNIDGISLFNWTTREWEDLNNSDRWEVEVVGDIDNMEDDMWGLRITCLIPDSYDWKMKLYLNKIPRTQMLNATLKSDAWMSVTTRLGGEVNIIEEFLPVNTQRSVRIRKLFPFDQAEQFTLRYNNSNGLTEMDVRINEYMHFKNQIHLQDIQLFNITRNRFENIFDHNRFEIQFKDDQAYSDIPVQLTDANGNPMYDDNGNPVMGKHGSEINTRWRVPPDGLTVEGTGFRDGPIWGFNQETGTHIFGQIRVNEHGTILEFIPTHCPNPPTEIGEETLEFFLFQRVDQSLLQQAVVTILFQTTLDGVSGAGDNSQGFATPESVDGWITNIRKPMAVVPKEFKIIHKGLQSSVEEEFELRISKTTKRWSFVVGTFVLNPNFFIPDDVPANRIYLLTDRGRFPLINPLTGMPTFLVTQIADRPRDITPALIRNPRFVSDPRYTSPEGMSRNPAFNSHFHVGVDNRPYIEYTGPRIYSGICQCEDRENCNCPLNGTNVQFMNVYRAYEDLRIHVNPYPIRSVYTLRNIPSHGFIDLNGILNKPLNKKYFEFWVNGRLMYNEVSILSPTKLVFHGLTSLRNLEIIEIDRDPHEFFSDLFLEVRETGRHRLINYWNFDTYFDAAIEGRLDRDNYKPHEIYQLLTPVWPQVDRDHFAFADFPPNVDTEPDILLRIHAPDIPQLTLDTDHNSFLFTMIDGPSLEGRAFDQQNMRWEQFGWIPIDDQMIIDLLNEEWADEIADEGNRLEEHVIISEVDWLGITARMYTEYGQLIIPQPNETDYMDTMAYFVYDANHIISLNTDRAVATLVRNEITFNLD